VTAGTFLLRPGKDGHEDAVGEVFRQCTASGGSTQKLTYA